MGILKLKNITFPIIWGGFIYFILGINSCTSGALQNTNIEITNSDTICNFHALLNKSDIVSDGVHTIKFNNEPILLAFLKNRDTISFININTGELIKELKLHENVTAICCKDSSLCCFYENKYILHQYIINDSFCNDIIIQEKKIPPFFSDSIFIATNMVSRLFVIDSNHYLVPYKVENNYKNMLDTFLYIDYCIDSSSNSFKFLKHDNPSTYDYLYKVVTELDYNNNLFIYGFQKSNKISIYDFATKKTQIITLNKFVSTDFPKSKIRNLTFIRQYLKENDRVERILADNGGNLYIIINLNNSSKSKFKIYFYNKKKNNLTFVDSDVELIPEFALIKNNKLYVPNNSNCYTIFHTFFL